MAQGFRWTLLLPLAVWAFVPLAGQTPVEELAGRLVSAAGDAEREAMLAGAGELLTGELCRALVLKGNSALRTNPAGATAIYRLALRIAERIPDRLQEANARHNIGLARSAAGQPAEAMEWYRQSLAIYEDLGDKGRTASTLNGMGILWNRMGDQKAAIEAFGRALAITDGLGDKAGVARTLLNRGSAYERLGRYREAQRDIESSLRLSEQLSLEIGIAYATNNLAAIYAAQRSYDLAIGQLRRSLAIKERIGTPAEVARTLSNIAAAYSNLRQFDRAQEFLERSLKLSQAAGDRTQAAATLHNLGAALQEQRKYDEATGRLRESLELSEAAGDRASQAGTLVRLGQVAAEGARYEEALRLADKAYAMGREIGDRRRMSQSREVAGIALEAGGKTEAARAAYAECVAIVEEVRAGESGPPEAELEFFEDKLSVYHKLIALLARQGRAAEAFQLAERAKARALAGLIQNPRASVTASMTAAELAHERELIGRMGGLQRDLAAAARRRNGDKAAGVRAAAALEGARKEWQAFRRELYAVHPELRMRRGDIEPATAEEAAALLPGTRAAILSYTVTPSETLVFAATHKGGGAARVVRIPVAAADLDRRVTRFREQLAARDLSYRETARALYTLLLGPVRAELQGITDLVIVPDGPLWHLPFQALESPAGRALLQECALSYAPSVTVLRELAGRPRRQAGLGLLAIGNPPPRPGTEPLPEAERELRAVAALYGAGSRAYTGSGASEARFKGEAGGYRVVHVATHGVFDDRSPMHSYLSLAPGGGAEEEDGLLEARELLEANLGADLVVLAACETGRGRAQRGEGLIGMTWALLAAGSPTAVASQWKVDSTATTELMLEFHRQWRTRGAPPGPTRAGALRRAALKVMEQPRFRHPFYWAGFVLVGNGF